MKIEGLKAEEEARKAVMERAEEMAATAGEKAKAATEEALRKEVERMAREAGEAARKEAIELAHIQGNGTLAHPAPPHEAPLPLCPALSFPPCPAPH